MSKTKKRRLDSDTHPEYKEEEKKFSDSIIELGIIEPSDYNKIKLFEKTYNANYIKSFGHDLLSIIHENCKNPVYKKLIYNLTYPKRIFNFDFIEGPITVQRIVLEENQPENESFKTFYFFGEYHRDSRGHCEGKPNYIQFEDYVELLARASPSFIDIYIELPLLRYKSNEYIPGKKSTYYDISGPPLEAVIFQTLSEMLLDRNISFFTRMEELLKSDFSLYDDSINVLRFYNKFKKCIQPSTQNEDSCKTIRVHNIDIRNRYSTNINELDDFIYFEIISRISLMDISPIDKIILLKRCNQTKILEILKQIEKYDVNIFILNTILILLTNPYIYKEWKRSYLKNDIMNFISIKYHHLYERINLSNIHNLITSIENDIDINRDYSEIGDLTIFIEFGSIAVDFYSLCRIFKKYKNTKNQPEVSSNIIVYSGEEHTQNISQFLSYLEMTDSTKYKIKHTQINKTDNEDKNCVKMIN